MRVAAFFSYTNAKSKVAQSFCSAYLNSNVPVECVCLSKEQKVEKEKPKENDI